MGMMSAEYRHAVKEMRKAANGSMRVVDSAWKLEMREAEKTGTAPTLNAVIERIKKMCSDNSGR